jgi:hypothetical protein
VVGACSANGEKRNMYWTLHVALNETTSNISQCSRRPGQDSNREPPERKSWSVSSIHRLFCSTALDITTFWMLHKEKEIYEMYSQLETIGKWRGTEHRILTA